MPSNNLHKHKIMALANPYLHFNGNCEEAFLYYKSVFGGEFHQISRYKDGPADHQISEKESDMIMHISLPLGEHSFLLGSDIPEAFPKAVAGTNFFISLHTDSEEETKKLYNALSAAGQIMMPLDKTFWGSFFGMFVDQFGIQWMISNDYPA